MKKYCIGNKLFIFGLVFILLGVSSVYSFTIRQGTNPDTGISYFGATGICYNSLGHADESTRLGIQNMIDDLDGYGGTVWVDGSNISLDTAIELSVDNVELIGTGGTIFYVSDAKAAHTQTGCRAGCRMKGNDYGC